MTLVEFFDRGAAIENIYACLAEAPQRVVLIGSKRNLLENHAKRYKKVLEGRGLGSIDIICRSVSRNNLGDITELLSQVVESCDGCVFDLTGGEELYLVGAGIVFEKYRTVKPVLMRRYNINTRSIYDFGTGTTFPKAVHPELSIEENICIYGGAVAYTRDKSDATYIWNMTEEFRADILKMWDICRPDPKYWNTQVGRLSALIDEENPNFDIDFPEREFLDSLKSAGIIKSYTFAGGFDVRFKNSQVKKVFGKAGQALELFVYLASLSCRDEEENAYFGDAMCGVVIDWDGAIGIEGKEEVENEIDVMAMRGGVPLFISCKNGFVEIDELYKLSAVAEKFGGEYARKILVASSLDTDSQFGKYFLERAKDMKIRIISNMTDMTLSELCRELKKSI